MAQSLQEIMQSLAGQYDPQVKLAQDQLSTLPGQETAAISGLDTARTNAFSDITNGANARGMMYSGTPINEQNRYVGEHYLPALAQVKQNTQQQQNNLQNAILEIRKQQGSQAQSIYSDQLNRDQQERQFQQQLQAQREAAAAQLRASQAAAQGLSLGGFGGGGGAAKSQQLDPMSVATGYAKTIKAQLLSAGNVAPFAREQVLRDIQSQFGLSPAQAQSIIYNNVFPDNWAGGIAPSQQKQLLQQFSPAAIRR